MGQQQQRERTPSQQACQGGLGVGGEDEESARKAALAGTQVRSLTRRVHARLGDRATLATATPALVREHDTQAAPCPEPPALAPLPISTAREVGQG